MPVAVDKEESKRDDNDENDDDDDYYFTTDIDKEPSGRQQPQR